MKFEKEQLISNLYAQDSRRSARCKYKHISAMLSEFKCSDAKVVRVEFDNSEYCSVDSARNNLLRAAKNMGFGIRTTVQDGVLYVIKKD